MRSSERLRESSSSSFTSRWIQAIFTAYRIGISPILHLWAGPGMGCRFEPTCSQYAQEAVRKQGLIRGMALSLRRIARCQPFSKAAIENFYDPVPEELSHCCRWRHH